MTDDLIAIGFLADSRREKPLRRFFEVLKQSRYKHHFRVIILTHEQNFASSIAYMCSNEGIDMTVETFAYYNNYMQKIHRLINFANEKKCEWCIKLDGDIVFHESLLDFMYEQRHVVAAPEDTRCMCLSPNLSSGIPTCDVFIKDFFHDHEIAEVHELFLKYIFGVMWDLNYCFLNKYTRDASSWDIDAFQKALIDSNYHYQGIHPLRVSDTIIHRFNEIVLQHCHELTKPQAYYLYTLPHDAYMCNGFFMIATRVWKEFIHDTSLYVDNFDEVPLNKYCKKMGYNKMYIGNSFAIHPYFNSTPNHICLESMFYDALPQV